MSKPTQYIVELKEIKNLTSQIFLLVISKPHGFDFKAGQFITMQTIEPNNEPSKLIRSYSISSSPRDENLEIVIKNQGIMSNKICLSKPNDKFKITGPFGHFIFDKNHKKTHVMLAGGSGITPFRSMIRDFSQNRDNKEDNNDSNNNNNSNYDHTINNKQDDNQKIILIYSNKTSNDILFEDEFEKLTKQKKDKDNNTKDKDLINKNNNDLVLVFTLTRPKDDSWHGNIGRIDKQMIIDQVGMLEDCLFYTCGPKEMVTSMIDILKELNIPTERIKVEKWG